MIRSYLKAWSKKLQKIFDVILISGGTSEGEEDYVREVLNKLGVKKLFWKVAIKPGKPIFLGKQNRALFLPCLEILLQQWYVIINL
jgi:Molybdopterin biosynthesis enzyme